MKELLKFLTVFLEYAKDGNPLIIICVALLIAFGFFLISKRILPSTNYISATKQNFDELKQLHDLTLKENQKLKAEIEKLKNDSERHDNSGRFNIFKH